MCEMSSKPCVKVSAIKNITPTYCITALSTLYLSMNNNMLYRCRKHCRTTFQCVSLINYVVNSNLNDLAMMKTLVLPLISLPCLFCIPLRELERILLMLMPWPCIFCPIFLNSWLVGSGMLEQGHLKICRSVIFMFSGIIIYGAIRPFSHYNQIWIDIVCMCLKITLCNIL